MVLNEFEWIRAILSVFNFYKKIEPHNDEFAHIQGNGLKWR